MGRTHNLCFHYLTQPEIGYIKINRFAETTSREFSQAITDLKQKGMTQLILDLRNNPGGYLQAAEQIADVFLAKAKLLLWCKVIKESKR